MLPTGCKPLVDGSEEFAAAADDLSILFTVRLELPRLLLLLAFIHAATYPEPRPNLYGSVPRFALRV